MYSSKKLSICLGFAVLFFITTLHTQVFASKQPQRYILLYDQLYHYAEDSSNVLDEYFQLRAQGEEVELLQVDGLQDKNLNIDSIIILSASSFESTEEYLHIKEQLKNYKVVEECIIDEKKQPSLMIAIDKVYPFSDLNKLMDLAETFNTKGIRFIVGIMPVYDNYELEVFDTYIEVLKYVSKMGSQFFIHYPIQNQDVKYDSNVKEGLRTALEEYRARGLDINGIIISQKKLFEGIESFEGLNLPFILITERKGKIDTSINLQQASQALNRYVMMSGINFERLDLYQYMNKSESDQQILCFNIKDDGKRLLDCIKTLKFEHIAIQDFKVNDYTDKIKKYDYTKVTKEELKEKTQYEEFIENEIKKIRGDNLQQEEQIEGYDISWFANLGIKIALISFLILIIQVFIGRHFDIRKFFKK